MERLVRIFPNPAKDFVRLSFDGHFLGDLQIFDNAGKLVREIDSLELPINISVKGLPKGLYLLKFKNESTSFIKKLIVY